MLLPRADGKGRIAAREILLRTPAVANHIRRKESFLLYNVMQGSFAEGMCPLEYALAEKVHTGLITLDVAESASSRPETLYDYVTGLREHGQLRGVPRIPAVSKQRDMHSGKSIWKKRNAGGSDGK